MLHQHGLIDQLLFTASILIAVVAIGAMFIK